MKNIANKVILAVCAIAFLLTAVAWAQNTVTITGRVTDQTGAVVPGAQVQVTKVDTGAVRTTQTSEDGSYSFQALPIGPYTLQVTREGFNKYTQSGIVLQVGTNPAIPVTLKLGEVSQMVEVQANAAMVETQSNGVGQVIQPEEVVNLPLNGRQATQLITLSGAAVDTATNTVGGGLAGSLDYPTAVSFSVAGSQGNATNYFLDGSSNMDYRTNVGEPMPFPDALQEFKVESSALPANLGNHPGGAVNAVTKSGTNSFHGDAFEFLRNGVMDAASYNFPNSNGQLGTPSYDNLRRNQFGGVIGGPIKRDKLFFFYGFQGTTERQQNSPTQRTVPTAAMLAGDFTALLKGNPYNCTVRVLNSTVPNPNGGAPQQFTTAKGSNILAPGWLTTPSAQINAKVAALYPTPTNPCGDVTTTSYQHDNEFQHVIRMDWQRTSSDTIFARYFITDYSLLSSLSSPTNILSSNGVGLADRVQNVSIGDTHVLSPEMISSIRINFERTSTQRLGNDNIPNLCALGMTNADCPTPHILQSLYLSPGNQGWDYENSFGISANLGWQINSHHLELGFTGEHIQMNGNVTFQLNPLPTFTSGGSSYSASNLADFVAGMPDSMGQGNGQLSRDGQNLPSLYLQDNWKMTRTFQVNLGVRWDPYFPSHNNYRQAADFSLAGYNAGTVSKVFVNAPAGVTFPGDAGFNGNSNTLNHLLQFAPRVGIVWDPRGKGTETIRAGYGMFYDTSLMWNSMHVVLNAPWGNTVSFTPLPPLAGSTDPLSGGGEANPYFGQPGGNIFPTPFHPPSNWPFATNGSFVFQNQQLEPANAQLWNLSFQKQISANWLVSASYLGSKTTHIWLGSSVNPDVVITAGMTAPGILANNVKPGDPTSGSCTLLYGGTDPAMNAYTFPTCNVTASAKNANVTMNGVTVNNGSARRALNLSNPSQGYKVSGGVLEAGSFGNASYNGLLASVQHRLSQGFSIRANYTWSHCLDDGEVGQDIADRFQDPANPKADWGNCGSDRRSIFNFSLVAETPKFSSAWMERILGGWTGSGIFTASTGSYSNVTDGADISLIGQRGVPGTSSFADRPDTVGDPFSSGAVAANPSCTDTAPVKTTQNWFNKCAFVTQPAATFGNTAKNSLLGPGRWNFDASIWRSFPVTERVQMDFRFEGFNVFNHPQFGNPGVNLSSNSSFGRITSTASDMRILQAAVKFHF
jgi:hypothetical protein